jgi:Tol biopolymer transport system component
VLTKSSGAANFSFSGDGSLVSVSGTTASTTQSVLVLVDRRGRETPVTEITADYVSLRFSPDGRHVAFAVKLIEGAMAGWQVDADVWVIEVERGSRTRLTLEGNNGFFPTWSPDSNRVAFAVAKPGGTDFYSAPADGSGLPEELFVGNGFQYVTSWRNDGRALAYSASSRTQE